MKTKATKTTESTTKQKASQGDSRPKVDQRTVALPVVTETRSAVGRGLELRYMPASEVRVVKGDDGKSKLVGYAAVFNSPSVVLTTDKGKKFVERIAPGAFAESLASGQDLQGLRDHEPSKILSRTSAKTLRMKEDEKGLAFEMDLPDTTLARDAANDVEHGNIKGVSFGFSSPVDEWTKDDQGQNIRTLKSVKLGEISLTPYPAYPATVVSTRSIEQAIEKLETPASTSSGQAAAESKREIFLTIREADGKEVRCGGSYGYNYYGNDVGSAAGMVKDYARATHDAISNLISQTSGLDRDLGDSEQQAVGDAGDAVDDLSDKIGDFYDALGDDEPGEGDNSTRSDNSAAGGSGTVETRGRSPSVRSACNAAVRSLRSAHDQCNSAMDAMGRSKAESMTDSEKRAVRDAVTHSGHVAVKAGEMRSVASGLGIEVLGVVAEPGAENAGKSATQTLPPGTSGEAGETDDFGRSAAFVSDLPVSPEVRRAAMLALATRGKKDRDDADGGGDGGADETMSERDGAVSVDADTLARAKKAIADGKTDDGKWSAPAKKDRDQKDCLGADLGYPIFIDGKVSLAALRDAASRGAKNAPKVGEAASALLKLAEKKK